MFVAILKEALITGDEGRGGAFNWLYFYFKTFSPLNLYWARWFHFPITNQVDF